MGKKVFTEDMTLEELDAEFDKLFEESIEGTTEEAVAETVAETEEEETVVADEEVVSEAVEDEEVEQTAPETPETAVQASKEQKQDYAFAQLRLERDAKKSEADALNQELADIATSLGFDSVNEMRLKIEEFKLEQTRVKKGIPEEQKEEFIALEKEKASLANEKKKLEAAKLERHQQYVEDVAAKISLEYGLTVGEMSSMLIQSQVSYEDLLQSKNPELLLRGIVASVPTQPKEPEKPRKVVDTQKLNTSTVQKTSQKDAIEALLEADLNDYIKSQGFM